MCNHTKVGLPYLQGWWVSSGGSVGRSSVVRIDWHSSAFLELPKIKNQCLMSILSKLQLKKCFHSLVPPGAGGSSDERPEGAAVPEKRSTELMGCYHLYCQVLLLALGWDPAGLAVPGGAWKASSSPLLPAATCSGTSQCCLSNEKLIAHVYCKKKKHMAPQPLRTKRLYNYFGSKNSEK